jgi:polysaccharide pyruvyl transferase WcaK-like protein
MSFKVHIIHVGNMANRGTQALLKSDVSVLRNILGVDTAISVSTTDIYGVRRMNLSLERVLPPVVDIPYERADFFAKKFGVERSSVTYKVFAVGFLLLMLFQAFLSVFSIALERVGLRGFYRYDVFRSLREADVVVSYSDENFKEAASFLPLNVYWVVTWWSMLFSRTWDVLCARFLGKCVVMFPNSVGPFRTWFGRFLARLVINRMDCVLIREPISYAVTNDLGVKARKILTADTTVLLERNNDNLCFEGFKRPLLGVSPGFYAHSLSRRDVEKYILDHAKALDTAVEKFGFYVVFLPHYVSGFAYDDLKVSRSIMRLMRYKDRAIVYEADSVEDYKSALDSMDLVISSKMHPAVLALSGCVPAICIAYDQKQTGFFQLLGLDDCVILIRDFSAENLFLKIDGVWRSREEIKNMLKEKIPLMRKNVVEAIAFALKPSIIAKQAQTKR